MIIVNQNKDTIINFDKVESIDIVADLDGTGEVPYKIFYETLSNREELGKYKTEKRAKEVLNEIVENYDYIERRLADMARGIGGLFNCYYEMPEE